MNQQVTRLEPGYHDIIHKIASVKDVDVDKLERMMKLQEEWEKRQSTMRFNESMSLAQGEMTQISKDSSNPSTRSRYASLEALDAVIRPIYTKHGFSVSFDDETPDDRRDGGWLRCIAYVSCGAETRKFTKWIPVSTTGLRGQAALTPTHASIASVTYARRALLKMIFNLAEEDTDGNFGPDKNQDAPRGEVRDITQDQMVEEMRACKDHTALYAYGQANRPTYLRFGKDARKLIDDIYKSLMNDFADAMDEKK